MLAKANAVIIPSCALSCIISEVWVTTLIQKPCAPVPPKKKVFGISLKAAQHEVWPVSGNLPSSCMVGSCIRVADCCVTIMI